MVGGWDFPDIVEGGRRYVTGSAEWAERYGRLLDLAAQILTSQGAHLYWVTSPPYRTVEPPGALEAVNAAVEANGGRHEAVDVVNGFAALATAAGEYSDQLPNDEGVLEWVRKDDGIHLCAAGAARFGTAVASALATDYDLVVDAAWELGEWRTDPRYVQGIAGGRCPG